ncbi:MAG: radical SAM protein [Bdellovibrio sp.]
MMLQIGEHCSAGCSHCPFTKNDRWFSVDEIVRQATLNESSYVTLTGGEPLEHPEIHKVVSKLQDLEIPFRLATGGHVDLAFYNNIFENPLFLGISLGTDIVSVRNSSVPNKALWKSNLKYIYQRDIPWSLTVTLGEGLEFSDITSFVGSNLPNFIMINAIEKDDRAMEVFKEDLKNNVQWKDVICL